MFEEGLLPVAHGMHWLRGRPTQGAGGAGGMAEDVPGTHAVMRPNRMEAWRCKKCHLILFRYGQSWEANKKAQMRQEAEAPGAATDTGDSAE